MKTKNKNLTSIDEFIKNQYGKVGTVKKRKFERYFEVFKIGFLMNKQETVEV